MSLLPLGKTYSTRPNSFPRPFTSLHPYNHLPHGNTLYSNMPSLFTFLAELHTTLTSILKQPPNLIFYLRQVPRTRFSINIDPSAQPNNLCTKNAQKTGEEKILSTIPSCIILSTLSSNNCSSLSFLRGFTTLCGIMRSFLVVFESKCCTTITNATERSQWIKKD